MKRSECEHPQHTNSGGQPYSLTDRDEGTIFLQEQSKI